MREFIRHPADIPIEVQCTPGTSYTKLNTQNVSFGGLAFISDTAIRPNAYISLRVPYLLSAFEFPSARVTWCQKEGNKYAIGVEFLEADEAFRVRMVEQVCHIESYRREIERREGRHLSAEQAADEWIRYHAASFPNP